MKSTLNYSLYLITDRDILQGRDLVDSIEAAIQGGVTMVQLREKQTSSRYFYQLAERIKILTTKYRIPFIINDRLDIALAVDADGLHIGQQDLPIEIARRYLRPDKIIGVSATTMEEACIAEREGADYLGVGAIFPTESKQDAAHVGLSELRNIRKAVQIPIVAIGGINSSNAPSVIGCGVDGISVISAILGCDDIQGAARLLQNQLDNKKRNRE